MNMKEAEREAGWPPPPPPSPLLLILADGQTSIVLWHYVISPNRSYPPIVYNTSPSPSPFVCRQNHVGRGGGAVSFDKESEQNERGLTPPPPGVRRRREHFHFRYSTVFFLNFGIKVLLLGKERFKKICSWVWFEKVVAFVLPPMVWRSVLINPAVRISCLCFVHEYAFIGYTLYLLLTHLFYVFIDKLSLYFLSC